MKTKAITFPLLSLAALVLQGCIAFPPLVQVEHKDSPGNSQEILRRLDAIDRRLSRLEQKTEKE